MAGTYPIDPKPQDISIKSTTQTYASVSQNLSVETRTRGIQRWEITLNYPPMNQENAMIVYSFIISQQGSFDSFDFRMPSPLNRTNGTQVDRVPIEGTPQVTDTRANISRQVQVGNFNRDSTVMKSGDLFKFSDHEKIYMLTADLETNSAGSGLMSFTPPILQPPITRGTVPVGNTNNVNENGVEIIYEDFEMKVSLISDDFDFPIDENVFYKLSVNFGERVNVTSTTSTT